jgi:hypothetical protein
VALTAAGQSAEPLVGTWKVNFAKSTYTPGPPPTTRSQTSHWESVGGGQLKNVNDSVDAKGQPSGHFEVILKFDGADYPVKGLAEHTTRSYKRIDARTFDYVQKVTGTVMTTTRSVLAPDGKTRVLTTSGTNDQGKPVKSIVLWEKQ